LAFVQSRPRKPLIDPTAESFTLLGGRLDYIESEPVAVIHLVTRERRLCLTQTNVKSQKAYWSALSDAKRK
jgi:hypothetical protein